MKLIGLLVAALALGACGGESPPDPAAQVGSPSPSTTFATAPLLIETDGDTVLLRVEVAETDAQRAQGLMHRRSLADDSGMVFIFLEQHRGGFWMKNTLIPLSIAFFDIDGTILKILDMDPCREDPCPTYDPQVAYHGALEVNQGAFDRWGVQEGDRIVLSR